MQKDQHATHRKLRHVITRLAVFALVLSSLGGVFSFAPTVSAQLDGSVKTVQTTAKAAGIAGGSDLVQIIGRIVNIFLGFLGVIFLVLMLYAGFLWMTAGGDDARVKTAKAYIRNAVIGLVIIASAWSIVFFILRALTGDEMGGYSSRGLSDINQLTGSAGSLGAGVIEFHLPERNATNVPRNTPIIITFKYPIQISSLIKDWTPETDGTIIDLNDSNVKIFPVGFENLALTPKQARVSYTYDHKTFVIRPINWLGSSTDAVAYAVKLTGGNAGIQLEKGGAAFAGSYSTGYTWGFETGLFADTTPPKIISAYPYSVSDSIEAYPRNTIVQITFDEAVDPTGASGKFQNGAGFQNIEITPAGGGSRLEGEFRISNRYRTVEFLTFTKCENVTVNSCGQPVYCLPKNVTLDALVKAATLSEEPPMALFDNGFDGLTDVVGNSLDGNKNDKTEGSKDDQIPGEDNYLWTFAIGDQIDLTPAKIVNTFPDINQSYISLDQPITATFDSLMRASTFTTEAAYIIPQGPSEDDPDTFWWFVGMNLLDSDSLPITGNAVANKSQLTMEHRFFQPSELPPPEKQNYYNPFLLQDLQDVNQNCFNPASSLYPDNPAKSCIGGTNCCNNVSQKEDCVFQP